MNEIQTAQMEAFIERNGYSRIGFEDYRGERIFVAERYDPQKKAYDVIWSTMGVRRYLECKRATGQADRQEAALFDARGFIDAAKTVKLMTRH